MTNLQSSAFVAKTTQLLSSVANLRLLLVMLLTLTASAEVWGADVTLQPSSKCWTTTLGEQTGTINGITISTTNGQLYYNKNNNPTQFRINSGATFSVTSSVGNITKIVFTFSTDSYQGGLSTSYSNINSTSWSATLNGDARIQKIVVTYTEGPAYTVNWTISPAAGGTLSATTGNSITVTPNATYTYGNPAYTVSPEGKATVSQNTNTFTATPTEDCTIQINMVEKQKNTYIDQVQGNSESVKYDTHNTPTLADKTQTTTGTCEQQHWHFMGWVTEANKENPTDVNIVKANTSVTANGTTFYAVWAKGTTTGGGSTSKQYSFDITPSNFNSTSYAANNNEKTSTATATDGSTMDVKWTFYQVMNQSSAMQWQKNNGYIYNSTDLGEITDITIEITEGTFTQYINSSKQPTTNGTGGYFQIKVGGATGKVSSIKVTFTLTEEGESTTTYSDYITSCITETLVSLDPNGGTISDVNGDWDLVDGLYKQTTTESNIVLPTITKGNWTFAGWDKDADGVKDYEATETITLNGTDVELSALWECTPLPAPTGLDAEPTSDGGRISWNQVTNATGYEISTDGGNTWGLSINGGSNTSHILKNRECETPIEWQVRAVGNMGNGYCEENPAASHSFTTLECGCPSYSFHYGIEGQSDWEIKCFEQAGADDPKYILPELFTMPNTGTHNYYVGYQGNFYNDNLGYIGQSKSENVRLQYMRLTQPMANGGGVYLGTDAVGATGTVVIYDNSQDNNLAGSFDPSGYGIKVGDTWNAFSLPDPNSPTVWETTDILTMPATDTEYQTGIATAASYVPVSNSSSKALNTMAVSSKEQGKKVIWFVPNNNWDTDNPRYAVYFFVKVNGTTKEKWVSMTKIGDKLYKCLVPTDNAYEQMIFCRMNPGSATNSWDTKWNQSGDLDIPGGLATKYTLNSNTNWDGFTDNLWSVHTPPSQGQQGKYRMWSDNASSNFSAHWIPWYVLTYDKNATDATGSTEVTAISSEAASYSVTTNSCGFTRTGYDFVNWQTQPNGGTAYSAGATYTLSADATLYAQWQAKNITITWNPNGGNVTPPTSTYTYDGASVDLPIPTRIGYTFNGWFDAASGGTPIPDVGNTNKPAEDVTYYAQWTAKPIPTLVWKLKGADVTEHTVTIASESNVFPTLTATPEAIKSGVKFESSEPTVATINANGDIILKSEGRTTIKAYYEEDATYAAAEATYELTVVESTNCWWEEVTIDDIEYGDEVVIATYKNGYTYALKDNDGGASAAPPAVEIKINSNKTINTEETPISNALIWNIDYDKEGNKNLIIYSTKNLGNWLYSIDNNNGIRVGTNANKEFTIVEGTGDDAGNFFLYHIAQNRYLGVYYQNPDWRGYTSINSYITGQTLKFYKKVCLPEGHYRVTWMVNGQEYTDGNPTTMVTDGQIKAIPTNPADDAIGDCADTFMGWSESNLGSAEGQPAPTDLFTTLAEAQELTITENKIFHAVFATKGSGGIAQGTVLWAENFAHFGTNTPSTAGTGTGTTIYGAASITYSQSNINTKGYDEEIAGGTKPELLLYKGGNHTWTIAGIPTGGAAKMTLSFLSNRTDFNVTSSTPGITINGSETAWNIEADSDVTNFTLTIKNTSDKNARLDNVSVIVAEGGVSYSNYVTNCCNTPAPTNGAYTSVSGTEIKLTWDDAANTNHYHITGGNLSAEGVYSDNKYCNITGLTECEEYTFNVAAYPEGGCESAAIAIIAQPYSGAKTVTFNPNGGAVSPTSFTTSCDKKSTTLPTPTYSGYRFMGWFTDESAGTKIDDNPYTPTEDITLFAHWEKEYTVTYDLQGGTASPVCSDDKYIAGEIVTICTSTPIKSGYKFTGWTYSPVVTITNGQFTMPASNVTITAEFVARAVTNIEVATNTHRVLMQGSAFIGEQIRVTYDNGETELLEWSNSKLTFAGHNTNELGVQTVTVTYTGEGTAHTQYDIEVIDGLGITFWDGNYTEVVKYEPGDLVDVDNRIGQNICSGWEFAGWSETKVANESNGFTPVHNFNATDAKVLYAVYAEIRMVKEGDVLKEQYKSADMVTDLQEGARYIVAAYVNSNNSSYGYTALTPNSKDTYYMAGTHTADNGFAYTEEKNDDYSNIYCTTYEIDSNNLWRIESDGDGYWQLFNIATKKYLDLSAHENQYLTTNTYPNGKIVIYDYISSIGDNDSRLELRHSTEESDGNKLYWDRKAEYFRQTVSTSGLSCIYCLTKDKSFTSTPPCSPLSATFHGNGGIVTDGVNSGDNLTITEPTRDAGITTPTASFADCNGKSWTFVGWSRKEIDVTRVPVLTTDLLHDGGGNEHYYIQEDGEEFWAVYTNQGTPETKYGTITFEPNDFPNTYNNIVLTITKTVNGDDYVFEHPSVASPTNQGIQLEEGKGYIKNITSLGKINSVSFSNFIYGSVNNLKVTVGKTADDINIELTEDDLQEINGVYTYYPKANYSFVKIASIAGEAVSIETISIDFGKGTQIWATTPDCSTITLSGDEIYVTATNGRAVMAPATLTVKANQLEANADVILTSNSSDVYFSTDRTFNFAAGQAASQKPKTSLTLPTDAEGNLATTDVYIHYMPSSEGDGVPENVVVSANLETPNPSITDDHTIHVRNLPTTFVIATKVGATWYALPADMTDDTNPLAEVIEVDEATMTATAPNTTTYTLWPVKTTNGTGNRYAEYGDRVRFAAVNYEQRGLWANNNNSSSAIRNYAVINSLGADGLAAYEWKVTTTVVDGHWQYTLQTDQTQNQNYLRYWTSAEGTPVGPKWGTYNAGENRLYFLPVTETQPFEYDVVEWYPTKMLIQTDAAITSPTVKVGGEEIASPELTSKGGKLYEISNLPLETNPNEVLQVSFTADAVNYVNAKVVPIILSRGEKSITGEPFATLTQKVYQYADIVVRDGATLTIDGGTDVANTLLGMTIYPTAKVSVAEGKKLSVHNLTFFGGIDEIYDGSAYTINKYGVPQLSLKGILNKTITNMDYIMRVNLDQMYQVGVPYDVNLSDITYWDGTTMTLGDNLYVSAYDGQKRANREEKSWVWETDFTEKVLKAGIGYTISADKQDAAHEYSIIRMPMKNNITSGNTETAKTVQVYAYDNKNGVEITDNHKGWNYLSNPYMVAISGAEADSKLVVGYLRETGTGPWEWDDDTYRYVTIPSDDGKWYDQQKFEEATLLPFKSFFLQIATSGELSFALASRQNAPARYLQSSNEQREVEFEVLLANDTRSDNLGFLIGEDYTPAYEINADLEKMIGSMSVYTIYNGYNLAYNALSPTNAAEQIPIGYVVPTVGEYTFALDESSDIEDVEHIYLIDYETSAITDLVTDVYTFTTLEQKSDTRFAINVALKSKDNTATGLDNMNTNGELPTKFIYQDKIYILHHGVIYDATGKRVITINK